MDAKTKRCSEIAKVMGWEDDPLYLADGAHEFHILKTWDEQITGNKLCLTHLLIERMVEDGWLLKMLTSFDKEYSFSAIKSFSSHLFVGNWCADFPAAVVELFCKVYGIRED